MKKYFKSVIRKTTKYVLGYDPKQTWSRYTRDALRLANRFDCLPEQLLEQQQHPERIAVNVKDRTCNWYLPPFLNPFYGGIMTILRLADYLQRCHGIKQRFLVCGRNLRSEEIKTNIAKAFPALSRAEVIVLSMPISFSDIPSADYSIATLWTTAYIVLGVKNTGYKFYMIQDFEPAFYPAGSTYAQAELSYHFGFYGIANTQSLKEIYERDYYGCAVVLRPSIDKTVFYPSTEEKTSIKRLFYYARPGAPRNGFELAVTALRRLKEKYGDSIDIVCAGADLNPADYGLKNIIRSVGMLPYAATGDLYRSSHVGLALMMTKHPSYLPLELMACGAVVVANFNPANLWLLKNGENCLLSAPTASCLTDKLSYALEHYEQLAPLRRRASAQILADSGDWDTSLREVAGFILEPPAKFSKSDEIHSLYGSLPL